MYLQNRKPLFVPGRCKDDEYLYPGDHADEWVCDCKPGENLLKVFGGNDRFFKGKRDFFSLRIRLLSGHEFVLFGASSGTLPGESDLNSDKG